MTFVRQHRTAPRFAVLLGLSAVVFTVLPAIANPITKLPGRWSGWGAVTLASGETERVKCVATYFVKNGGANLRQNLRCASSSYKIDSIADLAIRGSAVSGQWQERTHSRSGAVAGTLTAKGLKLAVTADTFTATMSLTTGKCKQSITFVPTNLDVTRISIGLRKC